jgi:proline dehydrogenase
MRRALLWASTNPLLAERLPRYEFVKRATKRFMPGEELDDALREAQRLGESGVASTITLLGENVSTAQEADEVTDHYLEALEAVRARGVDAEISIKLTQLGLDQGIEAATDRVRSLVAATSSVVWIDMESSTYVDRTLEVFRAARGGADNVGVCLQSYLRRTKDDLDALLPLDPSIRLVKGAYNESPSVAFSKKGEVDQNYVRLASALLRARAQGGQGRPIFGTHDPRMIGEAGRLAHELGVERSAYECSMLFGIQRAQQERLARSGHTVRILISYGSAWFPWYMRRLAERPANMWFVVKQLIG